MNSEHCPIKTGDQPSRLYGISPPEYSFFLPTPDSPAMSCCGVWENDAHLRKRISDPTKYCEITSCPPSTKFDKPGSSGSDTYQGCLKRGYLTKRGFRWRKVWTRRIVELQHDHIAYYDCSAGKKARLKGILTLSTNTWIADVGGESFEFLVAPSATSQQDVWYLRASTSSEKHAWLEILSNQLSRIRRNSELRMGARVAFGGCAEVFEGRLLSSNTRVAMKMIPLDSPYDRAIAQREIAIMKKLGTEIVHPSLCRLLNVYFEVDQACVTMPFFSGGELFSRVVERGYFPEGLARRIFVQLAGALEALHAKGIVHFDLKPENVLFVDQSGDARVVLVDFGAARELKGGVISDGEPIQGTMGYMAPELLLRVPAGPPADVFSLGVVLYNMVAGKHPFLDLSEKVTSMRTLHGRYATAGDYWTRLTPSLRELIGRLLEPDHVKRIKLKDAGGHSWVLSGGGGGCSAPHEMGVGGE